MTEKTIEQTKIALDWAEDNLKRKGRHKLQNGETVFKKSDVQLVKRARELHDEACMNFLKT